MFFFFFLWGNLSGPNLVDNVFYMMPMNLQLSQCFFGSTIEMQNGLKFMSFLFITNRVQTPGSQHLHCHHCLAMKT